MLDNEVVTVYRNFEKGESVKMSVTPQRIFEGLLLGIADAEKTLLVDWRDPATVVHKIELSAEKIWWDDEGELLALATETKLVLYQFNRKNRNLS